MKWSSNTIIILLIAAFESLWLQDASVSAAPFWNDWDISRWIDDFTNRTNSKVNCIDSEKSMKGPIINYGSITNSKNNVYAANDGKYAVYGSVTVNIGKFYSNGLNGTIEEKDREKNKNGKTKYGTSDCRAGNSYVHNRGSYQENIKNNNVLGADVKPSDKQIRNDFVIGGSGSVFLGSQVGTVLTVCLMFLIGVW